MNCVGDWVWRDAVRVVRAARREGAADDLEVGVDVLQRVVGLGQQLLVGGRGGIASVRAELGQPEEVEVGLVADDHRPHVGQLARERRGEGRERRAVPPGRAGVVRAELVDEEHRLDLVRDRRVRPRAGAAAGRRPASRRAPRGR